MVTYTPPGWPAGVHPPGSDDFESTAVGWLLDVVPPDYRLHGVLRRYPVALATMARHHSRACVEGARQGYRMARTELADALPPHAVDTVLAAYRKEGARLAATAHAVGLVERALRGEVFTPRMDDAAPTGPETAQPQIAEPRQTRPTAPEAAVPEAAVGPTALKAAAGATAPGAAESGAKASGAKASEAKASGAKASGRPVAARVGAGRAAGPGEGQDEGRVGGQAARQAEGRGARQAEGRGARQAEGRDEARKPVRQRKGA